MCNIYSGTHTFTWTSDTSSSSVSNNPPDKTLCQCKQLTYKQAIELAHKNLLKAESRRQKEREAEANYWNVTE